MIITNLTIKGGDGDGNVEVGRDVVEDIARTTGNFAESYERSAMSTDDDIEYQRYSESAILWRAIEKGCIALLEADDEAREPSRLRH